MPDGETRRPPSDAAIARAFAEWRPPMPFTVAVAYVPGTHRSPDHLWVAPYLLDATGKTILYLAAGPAGKSLSPAMIAGFGWPEIPEGVSVQIVTGSDQAGTPIFTKPIHTAN